MQRFDKMEKEMAALKAEINSLKAEKAVSAQKTAVVAAPYAHATRLAAF
jgi:uncharacterized small protein (DUF1192 family)